MHSRVFKGSQVQFSPVYASCELLLGLMETLPDTVNAILTLSTPSGLTHASTSTQPLHVSMWGLIYETGLSLWNFCWMWVILWWMAIARWVSQLSSVLLNFSVYLKTNKLLLVIVFLMRVMQRKWFRSTCIKTAVEKALMCNSMKRQDGKQSC